MPSSHRKLPKHTDAVAIVSINRARRNGWRAQLSAVAGLVVAGTWSTLAQARGAGLRLDAILLDVRGDGSLDERPGEAALSPREAQVMVLLAGGCRDKELPAHLHVTAHTARTYLRRAMAKLGVTSRAEALAVWSQKGSDRHSGSPLVAPGGAGAPSQRGRGRRGTPRN